MKILRFNIISGPLDFVTLKTDDTVKNKYIDERIGQLFISELPEFFIGRDYGRDVNEISYKELCLIEGNKVQNLTLISYNNGLKSIQCIVDIDYEIALKLEVPKFAKYIAMKYMEISRELVKLGLKDFDIDSYLYDLQTFFENKKLL